jgi:excisionase family DNA binding protein
MTTADEVAELSLTAAASALGRCEMTVRRWVESGRLPARRVAGRIRIKLEDVQRVLRGEPISAKAEGE